MDAECDRDTVWICGAFKDSYAAEQYVKAFKAAFASDSDKCGLPMPGANMCSAFPGAKITLVSYDWVSKYDKTWTRSDGWYSSSHDVPKKCSSCDISAEVVCPQAASPPPPKQSPPPPKLSPPPPKAVACEVCWEWEVTHAKRYYDYFVGGRCDAAIKQITSTLNTINKRGELVVSWLGSTGAPLRYGGGGCSWVCVTIKDTWAHRVPVCAAAVLCSARFHAPSPPQHVPCRSACLHLDVAVGTGAVCCKRCTVRSFLLVNALDAAANYGLCSPPRYPTYLAVQWSEGFSIKDASCDRDSVWICGSFKDEPTAEKFVRYFKDAFSTDYDKCGVAIPDSNMCSAFPGATISLVSYDWVSKYDKTWSHSNGWYSSKSSNVPKKCDACNLSAKVVCPERSPPPPPKEEPCDVCWEWTVTNSKSIYDYFAGYRCSAATRQITATLSKINQASE